MRSELLLAVPCPSPHFGHVCALSSTKPRLRAYQAPSARQRNWRTTASAVHLDPPDATSSWYSSSVS